MNILFACGGTGGHINPAIAVAGTLKARHPEANILFVGNPRGMEAKLVPKAGYNFYPIRIMGFQRQLNWFNIKYNLRSMGCFISCGPKIRKLIREFQPDVVMGTGGYVSGMVLEKAHAMGVKTICHEQNAYPGVSNRMTAKFADKVLLAVEDAKEYMPPSINYTVTGNPVREDIIFADRERARKALGVGGRFCILTFGGSLGARRINEAVADLMAWHCGGDRIHHIHATGSYGVELFPQLLKERGAQGEGNRHIDIREYIDNMAQCLAAADLVICRAGASTISELEAAGRASVLIPSPNVAANHQYYNALVLEKRGAAILIEEKALTGELLCQKVGELVDDPGRLRQLGENAQRLAILDANQRIYQEIMALLAR